MMNRSLFNISTSGKKRPRTQVSGNTNSVQVKVYVRVRPFNGKELVCACRKIVSIVDEKSIIFDPEEEEEPFFFRGVAQKGRDLTRRMNKNLHFEFDRIFDENATNFDVFEGSSKDIISSVFEGYNCSVFAYGATGAGKTFTMLGTPEQPGIAYLTIVELLKFIDKCSNMKVTLGVSYLEVYNENVKDLLNPSNAVLFLRENDAGGHVTVSGLKIKQIHHTDELFTLLNEGNGNRTQHPTDSNEESSRSHAVFQVHVRIASEGTVKLSKLSMIDLAGSERAAATGCKGERFKEGANINKSLLALGNCINALADGLKHVPYRDSKLTRILKDSLGGNCRTIMIANVSPSSSSFEDTYNTLKYATRTKCIKSVISKNVMNESLSIGQYKKIVQELTEKIKQVQENGMPDISPWQERIKTVFEEQKKIFKEILSLQSQAKLTDWRIQLKEQAIAHHDRTANIPCSDRLRTSINQLKARSASIRGRVNEYLPMYEENKQRIAKLEEDINAEPKIAPILKEIFEKQKESIELEQQKIRVCHLEKIIKMKNKHERNLSSAIDTALPVLNEYHALLRAHGYLTKDLASKYEDTLISLNGVKGISWCGDEDDEEEDSDYLQLRLNTIGENEEDFLNRAKTLTTTIYLPAPLKLNNRLGNNIKQSPVKQSKWLLKSRIHQINQKPSTPNKENIRRTNTYTPKIKFKPPTDTLRPNARPHPYRRTPLKPTPNTKVKTMLK